MERRQIGLLMDHKADSLKVSLPSPYEEFHSDLNAFRASDSCSPDVKSRGHVTRNPKQGYRKWTKAFLIKYMEDKTISKAIPTPFLFHLSGGVPIWP